MNFKNLVDEQTITAIEKAQFDKICVRWDKFSNAVGQMDKEEILKLLKYLVEYRPHSKTFGKRAVRRYNVLNYKRWEMLFNGDRETS